MVLHETPGYLAWGGAFAPGVVTVTAVAIHFAPDCGGRPLRCPLLAVAKASLGSCLELRLRGAAGRIVLAFDAPQSGRALLATLAGYWTAAKAAGRDLASQAAIACAYARVASLPPGADSGLGVFSVVDEFDGRMQATDAGFRASFVNSEYALSDSYPSVLYVPAGVADDILRAAASFRAKERIPVLCWTLPGSPAALFRSAQPATGLIGHRCDADERLVAAMAALNPGAPFVIIDARPYVNAALNSAKGYGTERIGNYPNVTLEFMGIGNIHVMRDSLHKLAAAVNSPKARARPSEWLSRVADSGWLDHVAKVLAGANRIAHILTAEAGSVLVHCSHGWDRTPQLTSLAQVLVDPYYRTLDGLVTLVQKEWLSFGHKFADRTSQFADVRVSSRSSKGGGSATPDPSVPGVGFDAGSGPGAAGSDGPSSSSSVLRGMRSLGKSLSRNLGRLSGSSNEASPVSRSKGVGPTSEESPIFLQFLDALYQLLHQFPWAFEYNEDALIALADAAYSDLFGTFLLNFEAERVQADLNSSTLSVWPCLLAARDQFINPRFDACDEVLTAATTGHHVSVWTGYYGRYVSFGHPAPARCQCLVPKAERSLSVIPPSLLDELSDDGDDHYLSAGSGEDVSAGEAEGSTSVHPGEAANHVSEDEASLSWDESWEAVESEQDVAETGDGSESALAAPAVRWVPDSEAFQCAQCQSKFSISVRRHHCRLCGKVFCNKCTKARIVLFDDGKKHRVCDTCAKARH